MIKLKHIFWHDMMLGSNSYNKWEKSGKKGGGAARTFGPSEMSTQSEILYCMQLKGRFINFFTLGGQQDSFAAVFSLSLTMVEAGYQLQRQY